MALLQPLPVQVCSSSGVVQLESESRSKRSSCNCSSSTSGSVAFVSSAHLSGNGDQLYQHQLCPGSCWHSTFRGRDVRRFQGLSWSPRPLKGGRRDVCSSVRSKSQRTEDNEAVRGEENRPPSSRSYRQSKDFGPAFPSGGKQKSANSLPGPARTQQRGSNSPPFSGDGRNNSTRPLFNSGGERNGYTKSRVDYGRTQGKDFSAQRFSQGGNDRGGYSKTNGPRAREDHRTSGRPGSGKGSSRSSSSPPSSPSTQIVTPREATSQFVSDRPVHRAPWEQGSSSGTSSTSNWRKLPERDFRKRNPLLERLQRAQDEELESDDDADDDDDEDDEELSLADNDKGLRSEASENFDGRTEKSAMARIAEKLSNLPGSRTIYQPKSRGGLGSREGPDSTFGPNYGQQMLPPTAGRDWSIPDHPVVSPTSLSGKKVRPDTRFPWERVEDGRPADAAAKVTRVKPPSLAEMTVPEDELRRLRSLGILTRHRIKVGKPGVTNGIVESIQNEWRNSEVVRVKCEGAPAQNMKQTHETLEERTGGLVIWRAGGACLVYRGKDYVPPAPKGLLDISQEAGSTSAASIKNIESDAADEGTIEQPAEAKVVVPRVNSIYDFDLEKEMEDILSSLGPRYDDWTGMKPVPVDADLLSSSSANFKKPLRRLPYGVRPSLSNLEMTNLRRLARPLPPHFVLGVNRGLEGLARAIVKLWEKSEIAKISVKRGVQNTSHERMGEQLKRLTGGIILARDKFFIVLYRGKDFLPPAVATVLEERQATTAVLLEEEERGRVLPRRRDASDVSDALAQRPIAGTLAETLEARAFWDKMQGSDQEEKAIEEAHKVARRDIARRIQRKVYITQAKKRKAEVELRKVEKSLRPAGPPIDRENITNEERHMFSKLGLKMHAFLLLGRRGIFGGTVENMHLHWKHRELVKIIYKARDKIDLEQTARMLEYESGGILVATIPTNKGQAIIVYRGKNYQRPPQLRPQSLLTKRQALKRSIEMQRQQALTKHLIVLEKEIENMQASLTKLEDEAEDISESTLEIAGDAVVREDSVASLARAISTHFETHALVKVGVRGRASGASVDEILHQLEEATGGQVVFRGEASKVVLYRGWPEGQERSKEGNVYWEELAPELRRELMSRVENDYDDYLHASDWDEGSDDDDENENDENDSDDDNEDFARASSLNYSQSDEDSNWDQFEEDVDEDTDVFDLTEFETESVGGSTFTRG